MWSKDYWISHMMILLKFYVNLDTREYKKKKKKKNIYDLNIRCGCSRATPSKNQFCYH